MSMSLVTMILFTSMSLVTMILLTSMSLVTAVGDAAKLRRC